MFPDDAEDIDEDVDGDDFDVDGIDDITEEEFQGMLDSGELVTVTNEERREAIQLIDADIAEMERLIRLKKEVRDGLIREIQQLGN